MKKSNNRWTKKRIKKAKKKLIQPTMKEALLNPFGVKKKKKEVKKKPKKKYVVIKGKAYRVAEPKKDYKEKNDDKKEGKLSPLKKRLEAREKIRKGMFGV